MKKKVSRRWTTRTAWVVVASVMQLGLPCIAAAAWNQLVGGASPINQAADQGAARASLAAIGGVPFVAWQEFDGTNSEIRVARLNAAGTAWEQPWAGVTATWGGVNHDPNADGADASLAVIGGVPHVAWTESDGTNSEIRVARLDVAGAAWEQLAGGASPINQAADREADRPSLADIGGVPYVAWREDDGTNFEIRVARLDVAGTAWEQVVGGASPINQATDRTAFEPSLAAIGDVPHVAWYEFDGTNNDIRVARLNPAGTAWEQPWVGVSATSGGVNQADDQFSSEVSLAAIGGVLHVAWREYDGAKFEIRVARLDAAGTAWEQAWAGVTATSGGVNHSIDGNADYPSLAAIAGVPHVAWAEYVEPSHREIRVARLNTTTTAWDVVGGASPLNHDPGADAVRPSLADVAGVPFVAWQEDDATNDQLRVSRLEPEFSNPSAQPTDTGATLTVDVTTFGVPFEIGFQYGAGLASETPTQPTAGDVTVTVIMQVVSGLAPLTSYDFRPFAGAAPPAPRVLGPTQQFTTLSTPPPDPCTSEPVAATFRSLACRLGTLGVQVAAAGIPDRVQAKLVRRLEKATDAAGQSESRCREGNAKRAKATLGQLPRALAKVTKTIRSRAVTKAVDQSIRDALIAAAQSLRTDAATLRRTLRCPEDATDG